MINRITFLDRPRYECAEIIVTSTIIPTAVRSFVIRAYFMDGEVSIETQPVLAFRHQIVKVYTRVNEKGTFEGTWTSKVDRLRGEGWTFEAVEERNDPLVIAETGTSLECPTDSGIAEWLLVVAPWREEEDEMKLSTFCEQAKRILLTKTARNKGNGSQGQ